MGTQLTYSEIVPRILQQNLAFLAELLARASGAP